MYLKAKVSHEVFKIAFQEQNILTVIQEGFKTTQEAIANKDTQCTRMHTATRMELPLSVSYALEDEKEMVDQEYDIIEAAEEIQADQQIVIDELQSQLIGQAEEVESITGQLTAAWVERASLEKKLEKTEADNLLYKQEVSEKSVKITTLQSDLDSFKAKLKDHQTELTRSEAATLEEDALFQIAQKVTQEEEAKRVRIANELIESFHKERYTLKLEINSLKQKLSDQAKVDEQIKRLREEPATPLKSTRTHQN